MEIELINFKDNAKIIHIKDKDILSFICVNNSSLPQCCGEVSHLRDLALNMVRSGTLYDRDFIGMYNQTASVISDQGHTVPKFWIKFLKEIDSLKFFPDKSANPKKYNFSEFKKSRIKVHQQHIDAIKVLDKSMFLFIKNNLF